MFLANFAPITLYLRNGQVVFERPLTVAGQVGVDVPIKTLKSIWRQAQLPEDD